MDAKKWEQLCKLADVKKEALKLKEIKGLRELIAATSFPNGDIAEVLVAFMLGNFARLFDDGLKVFMSASLDRDGSDFVLRRFHINYHVQFKWNKKNDHEYPEYVVVIEEGADRCFQGKHYLTPTKGKYVLFHVLVQSGAYEEDEIYDFMEAYPWFNDLCDEVWRTIKN